MMGRSYMDIDNSYLSYVEVGDQFTSVLNLKREQTKIVFICITTSFVIL